MLQTINQITTNPQAADFSCVAFAALFYSCQFGVVELQAGKTRQPASQKPCLWLVATWQCERCNWQVAMCNRQIEIMDSSSWWIPIEIHSYQSSMWNMQRLYRWVAWWSSPKSSQRFPPTKSCMHSPTSKSTKILPFYGCGVGVYEPVAFMKGLCIIFAISKKKKKKTIPNKNKKTSHRVRPIIILHRSCRGGAFTGISKTHWKGQLFTGSNCLRDFGVFINVCPKLVAKAEARTM